MEQQSKQGNESKRKKEADSGNGASAALHDVPPEVAGQAGAALEAEKVSVEKGIDAWKKVVAAAPTAWAPRRELARVYKKAERWNAFIEVMKDAVEKASWAKPEDKVPVLLEMIDIYRDRLKLDVMVVNAFNQILNIQPDNTEAADALAAQYEQMKRWPDLISLLRKKAGATENVAEKVDLHLQVANLYLEKFSNQAEAIKAFEAVLELDPDHDQALGLPEADVREAPRLGEADLGSPARDRKRAPADGARGESRSRRLADGEAEEGADLDRTVEEGPRRGRGQPRRARRAGEAVRAREGVGRARRDPAEAGRAGEHRPSRRAALLLKLGVLFTEKLSQRPKATVAPGRRCWRSTRTTAAPRTR